MIRGRPARVRITRLRLGVEKSHRTCTVVASLRVSDLPHRSSRKGGVIFFFVQTPGKRAGYIGAPEATSH